MAECWNMKIIIANHKRKRNKATMAAHTALAHTDSTYQMKRIVDETLRAYIARSTLTPPLTPLSPRRCRVLAVSITNVK